MTYPEVKFLDPGPKPPEGQPVLKRHPLNAKLMPEPIVASPEWASFKVGLSAAGPENIPPIVITSEGLIMEGKRRWLAARELQWDRLACVVREETDAALLMIDALCGQRDLERGTKAYITILGLREYIRSAEARRLANLQRGRKTIEFPLNSPKGIEYPSEANLSNPEIADRIGCNVETIKTAAEIYRLFYDPKCASWKHFYTNFPDLCPKLEVLKEYQAASRAEMEPEILSGKRTIWQVRQAIAGSLPEMQRETHEEQPELALWADAIEPLRKVAPTWKHLSEENREVVLKVWRTTVHKLPEELKEILREELAD
jgi:hypothetical protein